MLEAMPYGDRATLLRGAQDEILICAQILEDGHFTPVSEWVIGDGSLLIHWRDRSDSSVLEIVMSGDVERRARRSRAITIPVTYDGPDLREFAESVGLAPSEVVELHLAGTHRVAFMGFMPGFGYMTGLPECLHLPRKSSPRERMEPGAVAIAAGYTGVYPVASPGGWWWIGNTSAKLFDPEKDGLDAILLHPGDSVEFLPEVEVKT